MSKKPSPYLLKYPVVVYDKRLQIKSKLSIHSTLFWGSHVRINGFYRELSHLLDESGNSIADRFRHDKAVYEQKKRNKILKLAKQIFSYIYIKSGRIYCYYDDQYLLKIHEVKTYPSAYKYNARIVFRPFDTLTYDIFFANFASVVEKYYSRSTKVQPFCFNEKLPPLCSIMQCEIHDWQADNPRMCVRVNNRNIYEVDENYNLIDKNGNVVVFDNLREKQNNIVEDLVKKSLTAADK